MLGNSGIEMMLKSMGLGPVLDAAKQLAESGAVQKIIQFADGLEAMNARLEAIARAVNAEVPPLIEGQASEVRREPAEPGSGSADRDVA